MDFNIKTTKKNMRLSTKFIDSLKAQDKVKNYFDGNGLAIQVSITGVKTWVLFYRKNDKQYRTTLANYHLISLSKAREWTYDCKKLLLADITPQEIKENFLKNKFTQDQLIIIKDYIEKWLPHQLKILENHIKLKDLAEDWIKNIAPIHRKNVFVIQRQMNKDIIPLLGEMPIVKIGLTEIDVLMNQIRTRGSYSMTLSNFSILHRILEYSVAKGIITNNPTKLIDTKLIGKKNSRIRALNEKEIGIFFRELYKSNMKRQYKLALHLLMLTMVRSSELRLGKWSEIDFEKQEWFIKSDRMKMKRDHIVYLSSQAIRILKELKKISLNSCYILPSKDNLKIPLGVTTLIVVIKLVKNSIDNFVIHDFRRTASTILHENEFQSDWIEKCLAHEQRGVKGIYNKAQYADGRKNMLQWWADFIDKQIGNYI